MRREERTRILEDGPSGYNRPDHDCEQITYRIENAATGYILTKSRHLSQPAAESPMSERQLLNKQSLGIQPGLPLRASDGDIEGLRADIQHLMDLEAIKQLKYAYFRCVDTCNLEELAGLLHEDVAVHFRGGTYEWKFQGRDEYVRNIGMSFSREAVGQHNAHHPEIQLLSDTEATALWYLADNMWILNHNMKTYGTALYWDRYLKVDGNWLIRETNYERVYEINETLDGRPKLSSHYLGAHGPEPQF